MTCLNKLSKHHAATIHRIDVHPEVLQRLNALGLRVGQKIQVLRRAPLSGPIHVRVGTTELILRKQDADGIFVSHLA